MDTATKTKRTRTRKPAIQTEALTVFVWRSRSRGFLVVVAHDLEEARALATAQQANLNNFVMRAPEAEIAAAVGEVAYLKQRP
jgi:hypothetical protein